MQIKNKISTRYTLLGQTILHSPELRPKQLAHDLDILLSVLRRDCLKRPAVVDRVNGAEDAWRQPEEVTRVHSQPPVLTLKNFSHYKSICKSNYLVSRLDIYVSRYNRVDMRDVAYSFSSTLN